MAVEKYEEATLAKNIDGESIGIYPISKASLIAYKEKTVAEYLDALNISNAEGLFDENGMIKPEYIPSESIVSKDTMMELIKERFGFGNDGENTDTSKFPDQLLYFIKK